MVVARFRNFPQNYTPIRNLTYCANFAAIQYTAPAFFAIADQHCVFLRSMPYHSHGRGVDQATTTLFLETTAEAVRSTIHR